MTAGCEILAALLEPRARGYERAPPTLCYDYVLCVGVDVCSVADWVHVLAREGLPEGPAAPSPRPNVVRCHQMFGIL